MTILDVKAILYFADLGLIEQKTILIRDSIRARSLLQNLVAINSAMGELTSFTDESKIIQRHNF